MIDIIPLGVRVIVKPLGNPESVGTIIVPKTTRELEPTEGVVISTGDDCIKVRKGMTIYYGRYSGNEFERKGEKYRIMNEEDILGIVEGANG